MIIILPSSLLYPLLTRLFPSFQDALDLLEPLSSDPVDFVRQGALIAMGMVLIQHNEAMSPRSAKVRKMYERVIADKHEDTMAKFGAIIGQAIIDAGTEREENKE